MLFLVAIGNVFPKGEDHLMPSRRHQSQLSFFTDDQPPREVSKDHVKTGGNVDNGNLSEVIGSKSKRTESARVGIKSSGNNHPSPREDRNPKGLSSNEPALAVERKSQSTRRGKKGSSETDFPARASKERLTVHLSQELINRIRNVVYWTPGLTLADLGEDAFTHVVAEREKKRGGAFPQRKEELKGGRPIK